MTAPGNRKKVRGWKRQVKRVRRWRDDRLRPDWPHLDAYGRDYVKLTLDPWYRLVRRQPPVWLRREMTHALLDVHDAWRAAVAERPDVTYLRVWLKWPNFIESQVVMATQDHEGWYALGTSRPVPAASLPTELGAPLRARLAEFVWEEAVDEYPLDVGYATPEFARWLARRPHRWEQLSDGTWLCWVRRGRLWIGRTP